MKGTIKLWSEARAGDADLGEICIEMRTNVVGLDETSVKEETDRQEQRAKD